jgi:hypothetical protein
LVSPATSPWCYPGPRCGNIFAPEFCIKKALKNQRQIFCAKFLINAPQGPLR